MKNILSILLSVICFHCIGYPIRSALGAKREIPEEKHNLPYDSEVEYLESDGGQYISGWYTYTGLENSISIYSDFMVLQNSVSMQNFILAVDNWKTVNAYNYNPRLCTYGNTIRLTCDVNGWVNSGLSVPLNTRSIISVTYSIPDVMIASLNDGIDKKFNRTIYFVEGADGSLFGPGRENGRYRLIGRIYRFFFYIDGESICDFIPVRKDGVGYMYDRVSGMLFGNSGTGDFIIGPDK